jgi:hypothetical protein
MAGVGYVDALQASGNDIVAVEFLRSQPEHSRMIEAVAALLDREHARAVQHDLCRIEKYAPRREQARQIRTLIGLPPAGKGLCIAAGVEFGIRVHEYCQMPAAQHVLVDRILRVGRQVARLDQQQYLDFFIDLFEGGRIQRFDIE